MAKLHTIIVKSNRRDDKVVTDNLENLISYFGYTLEVGQSWQHEKGNKKINRNPKTAKSLVTNLNNAKTNSAANGCPDTWYELEV
jgi:hypothetical protein